MAPGHVPRRGGPLAYAALLFVLAFACLLPNLRNPIHVYDEGLIALGAERVRMGEIPYRDFWTMYGPGQLFALAGLFKLFGASILVERVFDLVVRSFLALSLYFLGARLGSRGPALLAWATVVLWLGYSGFFGYPVFPALLFITLSMLALLKSFDDPRRRIGGGLLLGLAALFRHDLAAYALVAQTVVLTSRAFARAGPPASPPARAWNAIRDQSPCLAGMAAVIVPVAIFFLATTPFAQLLGQVVVFPLTVFPRYRALPYPDFAPTLEALPFFAPFVIYALTLVVEVASLRASRGSRDPVAQAHGWGMGLVAAFGLLAFNQVRVRADLHHLPPFLLPALALVPALWRRERGTPAGITASAALVALALIAALALRPAEYAIATVDRAVNATMPALSHGIARAAGSPITGDQAAAVRSIQTLVPPGRPIYVGVDRHDRIIINDPMFYFLADRPAATRYHELHPGLATTRPVQEEIAAELERGDVRYLVLIHFAEEREPNQSSVSSGVTFLDDYIAAHYATAQQLGAYRIMVRR